VLALLGTAFFMTIPDGTSLLTAGQHAAFGTAGVFAALGLIIALTLLSKRSGRRGVRPHPVEGQRCIPKKVDTPTREDVRAELQYSVTNSE
jgi:hypothetical protein